MLAEQDGIHLGQGSLFGDPQRDCVSTHKPNGLAYNRRD